MAHSETGQSQNKSIIVAFTAIKLKFNQGVILYYWDLKFWNNL